MTAASPPTAPPGFQIIEPNDGYIATNGPYYVRATGDGGYEYGFQSDARHVNPHGVMHGGAIVGFLDTILGHFVVLTARRRAATIGLDCRYIAGGPPGPWIEGRVIPRRMTRSLAFVDAEASADGTLLVTASGIFRIFDT